MAFDWHLTVGQWGLLALVFAAVIAVVVAVVQLVKSAGDAPFLRWFGPYWIAKYREIKRHRAFDDRILDLVMGLANAMKAGMALPQALEKVSTQMGGVMRDEITVTLSEYRLGMGIMDALARLEERMPSEDMRLITSAVRLTTRTGGSLVDVLTQLVDTIRNRTEFQQKLRTLTAQGRFEAIAMASAPLAAFVLLYFCQPDLMLPLVTTAKGWMAIGAAATLEIIGYIVIKKIITIEV